MSTSDQEIPRSDSWLALFITLAKHKRFILKFVVGAGLLSAVGSFLLPNRYRAEATILPPKQAQSFASSMLGDIGQLAGGLSAKDLVKNPSDLYVSMLGSRTIGDALIDRFSLMEVYKEKKREQARKDLYSASDIAANKDGIISIAVEDRDPHRAADLANGYVAELEKLTKTFALTDGARRRVFFEREVKLANDQLSDAEQGFKKVQERTGIIQLDGQSKVMLTSVAELKAQLVGKEVELQAMRSFATVNNPDLIRTEQEVAALRQQMDKVENGQAGGSTSEIPLGKVPSASLEYLRQLREVKYREALLQVLTKQYEAARIDESKDPLIIQTLDTAVPPESKSWPHRGLIVLSSIILGFFVASGLCLVKERLAIAKSDPEELVQLQTLRSYFFEGVTEADSKGAR